MSEMQIDKEQKNSSSKKITTTNTAKQTSNQDPQKTDCVLIDYENLMAKIVSKEQWLDFYKSYGILFFSHYIRTIYS